MGKPYLIGGQSTIVPPYMQRPGAYEPVADIEPEPQPDPELEPEPEPNPQSESESELSHSHSTDTSCHSDLPGNDYFPGSSRGGYHYRFDIFGLYPLQHITSLGPYPQKYSTLLRLYPPQHDTPPGSSSLMPFEPYDFSSIYQTPSPATEEDVGHRNHPQHERRSPQKYTPRTTPSKHQF
ncbi:hypothetical protein PVK06_023049 [Gossypium arboreum]|uniref:Uncharacterized protein n=1 Tax=Gossypium arboreum TaxID=29729 RepID=A0ABR0PA79_GOSAR|nr:hypothetical protein PVK06_023049 [Gossypium arboreum]